MKRSEMLKKLYKVVDQFTKNPDQRNLVDVILDEAERLGMAPPDRQRCFCHECHCPPNRTWDKE